MNDELMEFPSPLSLSSSLNGSLCIGEIPVAVPNSGDPNSAPSGIRLPDPGPAMVETRSGDLRRLEELFTTAMAEFSANIADSDRRQEEIDKLRDTSDGARDLTMKMSIQSRSADLLRMEETIRKAMGDLFSRLDESNRRRDQADRTCDQTLKELRDGFVALKVQNSELMVKLMADNGGNSSAASTGSNTRAHCFSTHQSKVDSPIVLVNDLNGSGTCITASKLLQSTASTAPENLQPRDNSVEECITRFPAEISKFIGSNSQGVLLLKFSVWPLLQFLLIYTL